MLVVGWVVALFAADLATRLKVGAGRLRSKRVPVVRRGRVVFERWGADWAVGAVVPLFAATSQVGTGRVGPSRSVNGTGLFVVEVWRSLASYLAAQLHN